MTVLLSLAWSLKKRVQIAAATGVGWRSELQEYLLSYKKIPPPATGKTPVKILFGCRLCTNISEFVADVHEGTDIAVRDRDFKYQG